MAEAGRQRRGGPCPAPGWLADTASGDPGPAPPPPDLPPNDDGDPAWLASPICARTCITCPRATS